jgi:hypothetical protein
MSKCSDSARRYPCIKLPTLTRAAKELRSVEHLAIYDAALEAATEDAEILLLHLLLANLVENLGARSRGTSSSRPIHLLGVSFGGRLDVLRCI